ncbi:MAG TPA: family 16 glycoside hydrolase [Verrucomicrobiae bacterium]|nr:family 16 glycoside hydrolase [Verrucomicrobiae bacterium]
MLRWFCLLWSLVLCGFAVAAAELKMNFSEYPENQTPPGFVSAVSGEGKPGDWKIIWDSAPSAFQSLNNSSSSVSRRAVLAQLSRDPSDEHFPLLIYEKVVFDDFKLTARVKTVQGAVEQMAGIAFRIQNPSNYYVVRASSLGKTFKFYKVVDGQRGPAVGTNLDIPSGVWHDISVEAKGDQIHCGLDGKDLISVRDKANLLSSGKIGFWTKSDSVSYFDDVKVVYKPHVPPAQALVDKTLSANPRLLDVRLYVMDSGGTGPRTLASRNHDAAVDTNAIRVIEHGSIFYGRDKGTVSVMMPLRDRNGEPIAAVRLIMKSFPGQTEENALARATPIVKAMQKNVLSLEDLVD